MKLTERRFYLAPAAAAVAFLATGCSQKPVAHAIPSAEGGKNDGGDSPVRVAGGSIITHAWQGWMGLSPYVTTSKTAYQQIDVGGWDPVAGSATPIMVSDWKIDIVDQNPKVATEGIDICSNSTCTLTGASSNQAFLMPRIGNGASGFYINPLPSALAGPGIRFYDGYLHTFLLFDNQSDNTDIYERISTITVTSSVFTGSKPFSCPEGECWIKICTTSGALCL